MKSINSIPSYVRLEKAVAGKPDSISTMLCSLNLEHNAPKQDIRDQHEWFYEDYFGVPSLAYQMRAVASDNSYAKKQREQPQSFIGKYEFLSNMYLCTVIIGDLVFPSAENAFQAMKCKTHKEMEEFQFITPYEAKKRGAEVDLRSNWNEIRDKVMKKVLKAKFEDQELAVELLHTDDMLLCEKNYWGDTYWGKAPVEIIHYFVDGAEVDKQTYFKAFRSDKPVNCQKTMEKKLLGENKLGKLLCEVRQEIKDSHCYDLYLHGYQEQADINIDWLGRA